MIRIQIYRIKFCSICVNSCLLNKNIFNYIFQFFIFESGEMSLSLSIYMFYFMYRYIDELVKCNTNIYYAGNYLQSGENEG